MSSNALTNIARGTFHGVASTLKFGVAKLTSINQDNSVEVRAQARKDMKKADAEFKHAGDHFVKAGKQISNALSNAGRDESSAWVKEMNQRMTGN